MKKIKRKYSSKYESIPLFVEDTSFMQGGIKTDPLGFWNPDNIGNPVIIPSNNIDMSNVNFRVFGISDEGERRLMLPNSKHKFKGKQVLEIPLMQQGGRKINPDEAPNYIANGYKDIGNNTLVKNDTKLKPLGLAKGSVEQGSLQYEQWLKSELQKGRSISELVKMGYGTEQGLGLLAQNIKPITDTVYYENLKPKYPVFENLKQGDFKGEKYWVKRGPEVDSVFFNPTVNRKIFNDPSLPYQLRVQINPENNRSTFIGVRSSHSSTPTLPKKDVTKKRQGGFSAKDLYSFLFDKDNVTQNTIPSKNILAKNKRGGFILPKAQAGINGIQEFNITPSSFQSAFPPTQQPLSIIPLDKGIQTETEEGKTPDNTSYTLRNLNPSPKDNYINPALFSFGKAAISALGTRIENDKKRNSVNERLFDPFQVLPNVTTNNEFLNK
jgi:hypothetical protein